MRPLHLRHPHGLIVSATVSEDVAAELHAEDLARARELGDARRGTFLAGRVALARALRELAIHPGPLPHDERGAPVLPSGFVGSISHKGEHAVALAAPDEGFDVGVDLERVAPLRPGLVERILTAAERRRLRDDREVLAAFSVKEAVYKAIDPTVRRYVGFHEVELALPAAFHEVARVEVTCLFARGEPAMHVEATLVEHDGFLLATARARR